MSDGSIALAPHWISNIRVNANCRGFRPLAPNSDARCGNSISDAGLRWKGQNLINIIAALIAFALGVATVAITRAIRRVLDWTERHFPIPFKYRLMTRAPPSLHDLFQLSTLFVFALWIFGLGVGFIYLWKNIPVGAASCSYACFALGAIALRTLIPSSKKNEPGLDAQGPIVVQKIIHRGKQSAVESILARTTEGVWTFVAMRYYFGILNRTYLVFVTDRQVAGAKVMGMIAAPQTPDAEWNDPLFYVSPSLATEYAKIDVASESFLARCRDNFRIDRNDIQGVRFSDRPKWGMGTVPYSGRIFLRKKNGTALELILLGTQDGPDICMKLKNTIAELRE